MRSSGFFEVGCAPLGMSYCAIGKSLVACVFVRGTVGRRLSEAFQDPTRDNKHRADDGGPQPEHDEERREGEIKRRGVAGDEGEQNDDKECGECQGQHQAANVLDAACTFSDVHARGSGCVCACCGKCTPAAGEVSTAESG